MSVILNRQLTIRLLPSKIWIQCIWPLSRIVRVDPSPVFPQLKMVLVFHCLTRMKIRRLCWNLISNFNRKGFVPIAIKTMMFTKWKRKNQIIEGLLIWWLTTDTLIQSYEMASARFLSLVSQKKSNWVTIKKLIWTVDTNCTYPSQAKSIFIFIRTFANMTKIVLPLICQWKS